MNLKKKPKLLELPDTTSSICKLSNHDKIPEPTVSVIGVVEWYRGHRAFQLSTGITVSRLVFNTPANLKKTLALNREKDHLIAKHEKLQLELENIENRWEEIEKEYPWSFATDYKLCQLKKSTSKG